MRILRTLSRLVRMCEMQGSEDEADGSLDMYVTKAESDSNTADRTL